MSGTISIKKKITYSFSALMILITATAIIAYTLVQQVEKKMYLVEVIDDFLNLTLELRRYEKNYFLYKLDEDYEDNLEYLDKLEKSASEHTDIFTIYDLSMEYDQVNAILIKYRKSMTRYHQIILHGEENYLEQEQLDYSIRDSGQKMTLLAEQIASREKESIQNLLRTSQSILLSSTGTVFFLALLMVTLLRKKILTSLKLLEDYTRKVAQGEMVAPPDKSVDEEINTLFQAFTRMNNELQLRQRQMVQSEKLASLGTLLAGVAHELNNPLSNISTSAQILSEELDASENEFHTTLVSQIEEQTDKARDIVKTLLEFSRTRKFAREELNLYALVQSAIKLLRSEIPSEMEVELDLPDNLTVWVDKQRMQQIFLNLIKNAVDACEDKGKIWISATDLQVNNRKEIEILVSDNGPGIPPQDFKKIFDPFYSSKDVGKGSGLGLFIVHDIIESHGGTITVDSRVGEGTTFIIWLPGGDHTA